MHYRHHTWSGHQSEIDSQNFFLSPKGKSHAVAELAATWEKMQTSKEVRCNYPARADFLNRHTNLKLSVDDCKDFQDWRKSLKVESVSVVYTAPYFGSPASLFGHTFFKLNPKAERRGSLDPLAQVISFEAVTGDSSGAGYAVQGLLGMFPGMYSQQPYFVRTNLYTNIESRDIWEYELQLSPDEINRLLMHLWELRSSHSDYYFFDENCSYHLLALFEVARPGLKLRDQFYLKAIPIDTVRALTNQFTVLSLNYRPSLMNQFHQRYAKLNSAEKQDVQSWIHHKDNSDESPHTIDNFSLRTIDTLIDYEKYKTFYDAQTLADRSHEINHQLLKARARFAKPSAQTEKVETASSTLPPTSSRPPDPREGHGSTKLSLSLGKDKKTNYLGFQFRAAIHDHLDSLHAQLDHSTLEVLKGDLRFYDGQDWPTLNQFVFASVETYAASDILERRFAWRMSALLSSPERFDCKNCLAPEAAGAYGYSWGIVYALLGFRAQHSQHFKKMNTARWNVSQDPDHSRSSQLDVVPEVGLRGHYHDRLRWHIQWREYLAYDDFSAQHDDYQKLQIALSYGDTKSEWRCRVESFLQNFNSLSEDQFECHYAWHLGP